MPDTLPLWRQARDFIVSLFVIFGGPEVVVARGVLMPREARLMQLWLSSMEKILRRLLLIEAAALPAPALAPPRGKPQARVRREVVQNPDAPETWRVAFTLIERVPPWCKHRGRKPKHAAQPRSPWPLAERFEAIVRVFNDRAAYAKRLARRLARAPRFAALILLATLMLNAPGRELYADTTPLADLATEHFNPPRYAAPPA